MQAVQAQLVNFCTQLKNINIKLLLKLKGGNI